LDARFFEKLLQQERKALAVAWETFISLQKEGKVPYPALYSETFSRKQGQREISEPELLRVLEEASSFLEKTLAKLKKDSQGNFAVSLSREEGLLLREIQKKLAKLEQEIAFLREEVLKDPLTKFWNRRGLQHIFDKVVRPHIYNEDYQFLVFSPQIPEEASWAKEKVLLACAHFLKGLFSPRDFLTRPSGDLFAVITVGRNIEHTQTLMERLRGKFFPCTLRGLRLTVGYRVGGTNILGADHLDLVMERATSAARKDTFYRV